MKKTIIAAALVAVGGAAAVAFAPSAQADPGGYLRDLASQGFVITNTNAALASGYRVCQQLGYTTGDVVAANLFATTTWAETSSLESASRIVITAVDQLCPQYDHRGQST